MDGCQGVACGNRHVKACGPPARSPLDLEAARLCGMASSKLVAAWPQGISATDQSQRMHCARTCMGVSKSSSWALMEMMPQGASGSCAYPGKSVRAAVGAGSVAAESRV